MWNYCKLVRSSDTCLVTSSEIIMRLFSGIIWEITHPEHLLLCKRRRGEEDWRVLSICTNNKIFSISDYKENTTWQCQDHPLWCCVGPLEQESLLSWTKCWNNTRTSLGSVCLTPQGNDKSLINQNCKNLASQVSPARRGGWESLQFRDKNCDGGCDR